MKTTGKLLFYILTIGGLLALIYVVINAGSLLENTSVINKPVQHEVPFSQELLKALHHPLAVFLFQVLTILIAVRLCSALFKKIGQPPVMGEMAAGIILGPSVLGAFMPAFSAFVFPKESLSHLQLISQVGLILFMFVVGMELELGLIKKKAGAAVIISHASIVFPYGLGVGLSYFLYKEMAPAGVHFYAFALFMGIAMSITAFPVLARVIRERGLTGTKLGTIAITCAAADDITAWCILAFVVAVAKSSSLMGTVYVLAGTLVYVMIMLLAVKPMLKKLAYKWLPQRSMQPSAVGLVFIVLLVSSYICEVIGVHALFGAFMAGIVMPDEWNFRKIMTDKIEDVALVLFLPLFFVFTGLRTEIGLLSDASLWGMCIIIILVAIAGKFGGSAIAARFTGESLGDSLAIGALMNTRGLMELVVLNIGYDLSILSPQIFTMLVLMALVTTFMTAPALTLIGRAFKQAPGG
jgi:Kef-type K+ transport system membrane component KefB